MSNLKKVKKPNPKPKNKPKIITDSVKTHKRKPIKISKR